MEEVTVQKPLNELDVKQDDKDILAFNVSLENLVDNGTKKEYMKNDCHVCVQSEPCNTETEGLQYEKEKKQTSNPELYHCGVCSETFCTICRLHKHLTTFHLLNGSYCYDYFIKTAFPKYKSMCQFTQTDDFDFNREGVNDSAERKRHCHQIRGHEVEDCNVSKSKVRKKAKVKKEIVKENVKSSSCLTEVKVEIDENEMTVEAQENDGYNTDRTDDYFEDHGDAMSDIDNNSVNGAVQTDLNAKSNMIMPNAKPQKDSKSSSRSKRKSRDPNDIKSESQKNGAMKQKIKLNATTSQGVEEGNAFYVANSGVKKKFSAKVNSVKGIKQTTGRKNNLKKTKDNTERKKWKNESSEANLDQVNKDIVTLDKTEENKLSEKTNMERNRSEKKSLERIDQSASKYTTIEIPKLKKGIEINKCEICDATFTVKQGLLRHEQLKHADQMNFKCDKCDKKFMRNFNLQKHIAHVHSAGKGNKQRVKTEQTSSQGSAVEELVFEKSHSENSSGTAISEEEKGKQISDSVEGKLKRKRRTNEEMKSLKTPHTCELCGHTMPKSKMDVHKRLHTGERPFICTVCGKGLISQNKLSRHMLIHGEMKRHTCDVCGVGFHMKYKLRMHMHIHTGKKPYLCSICGAEFNHSANLATHTRCVHLQVKPYVCNICGGRYSKRSQLDDHVLSHSTERQFTCRYCGKSFKYFKGMRRHEKGHMEEESFSCGHCGLKFARKENLDRHKVSHGDTNFQCKTCKKVLKDGRALQEHEFTHLVAKGCKCSVCGEMFYSSNKYFTHVFAMHNIQKHEAQVMIIDEKLQREKKQNEASQNVPLSTNSGIMPTLSRSVTSFDSNVSGILDTASKETMNVLTRVATENLRLHSQDILAEEKTNLIIPPLNPMILYEKNRVTSLDNSTNGSARLVLGNTTADSVNFPDHAYGQSIKQQVETTSRHHGNMNLTHQDNSLPHHGLNETVLGFVTGNTLSSINNLNSYLGQRQTPVTPLASLAAGLHQDEHGAIESLRRLQDNPVTSITLVSSTEGMVANQGQCNVMSSTGASEENTQADYRIQNLY